MADNAPQTLTERFLAAAKSLEGSIDTHVALIEARNLCEKFELFWEMADNRTKKAELSTAFANVVYDTARQIVMQPTTVAADAGIGVTIKMFNMLKKKDPDWVASSNLAKLFQSEADALSRAAELQTTAFTQDSLTRAADTLTLLALASRPASTGSKAASSAFPGREPMTANAKLNPTARFNAAAHRLNGVMNMNVFGVEVRNLCEKFELLWDAADDLPKKAGLTAAFAFVLCQLAGQIKTQTNTNVVEAYANATTQMFNTLKAVNPGSAKALSETSLFQTEANALSQTAKRQVFDFERDAFLNAAKALNKISGISPAPAAPPQAKAAKKPRRRWLRRGEPK
jgi:hypothetical protein